MSWQSTMALGARAQQQVCERWAAHFCVRTGGLIEDISGAAEQRFSLGLPTRPSVELRQIQQGGCERRRR